MKVSVKQVFLALIAMVLTLGVLRGAQWMYTASAIKSPLVRTIGEIHGVRHVTVNPNGNVFVSIRSGGNLMTVYQSVSAKATDVLGHAPSGIELNNSPTPALTSLANQSRFVVAQGEATGQYVTMKNALAKLAQQHRATAVVEMGSTHLYITLKSGHHVLYQVIPLNGGTTHV